MADADARFRHAGLQARGDAFDRADVVVEPIHLPAAAQFPAHRVGEDPLVVLEHVRLHGMAVLGRLLEHAHVADAAHRHVQRARDRRRGKRQHIDIFAQRLELFLLRDAEALLFVDDYEPQIAKLHVVADEPVRADNQVDFPAL